VIDRVITEMASEGDTVTVVQACRWAGISRPSYYYRPRRKTPRVNEQLAARVKRVIEDRPYAGYRTVAWLLGENKNTIQRLFQLKGWQVRKRQSGARPRAEAVPPVASRPNER
jgi:putative transposase